MIEADRVRYLGMVTKALIALNILVFVLMGLSGVDIMSPTTGSIVDWGGISGASVASGQWWRLLTSMFVHIGAFHLAMNMYALYSLGSFLERFLGKALYLCAYLVSGILGGLCSYFAHRNSFVVSAGASGAIAGIFGLFVFILLTPLIPKEIRRKLVTNVGQVIGIKVGYGLMRGGGIDHVAHLGGLFSGALIGALYYPFLSYDLWAHRFSFFIQRARLKWIGMGVAVLLGACLVPTLLIKEKPSGMWALSNYLEEYNTCEQTINSAFQNVDFAMHPQIVYEDLSKQITPSLETIAKLSQNIKSLDVDTSQLEFKNAISRYLRCYEQKTKYILRSIDENTNLYEMQIKLLDNEMKEIIEKHQKSLN